MHQLYLLSPPPPPPSSEGGRHDLAIQNTADLTKAVRVCLVFPSRSHQQGRFGSSGSASIRTDVSSMHVLFMVYVFWKWGMGFGGESLRWHTGHKSLTLAAKVRKPNSVPKTDSYRKLSQNPRIPLASGECGRGSRESTKGSHEISIYNASMVI